MVIDPYEDCSSPRIALTSAPAQLCILLPPPAVPSLGRAPCQDLYEYLFQAHGHFAPTVLAVGGNSETLTDLCCSHALADNCFWIPGTKHGFHLCGRRRHRNPPSKPPASALAATASGAAASCRSQQGGSAGHGA